MIIPGIVQGNMPFNRVNVEMSDNNMEKSAMISRRKFCQMAGVSAGAVAGLGLSSCGNLFKSQRQIRQPNILFIMSDDHCADAIGSYNGRLSKYAKTQNIDKLAKEGMLMNNVFCTNSVCAPSRGSIMTGKYSHTNGIYYLFDRLDPKKQNVAKLLQQAGYQTAIYGKWQLRAEPSGFDDYAVVTDQGGYFNPEFKEKGKLDNHFDMSSRIKRKGYATDVITDKCLDWLKNRQQDKPFMLMCNHKAPHAYWRYAPRHAHLYKDIDIPEPDNFNDNFDGRPGSGKISNTMLNLAKKFTDRRLWDLDIENMSEAEAAKAAYQKYAKDYLRCVAAIDESVEKLYNFLEEEGTLDNTIIIYSSDQGEFLGAHGLFDKRVMLEESLRMPFIVRYPKEIKAGSTCDRIGLNIDFPETLLDYAGAPIPVDMQGRSMRPLFQGRNPADWRTSMFYAYYGAPPNYGIRTERYKLINFVGAGWELYDMKNDPHEMKNLYKDPQCANIVKDLNAQMKKLRKQYKVEQRDLPVLSPTDRDKHIWHPPSDKGRNRYLHNQERWFDPRHYWDQWIKQNPGPWKKPK